MITKNQLKLLQKLQVKKHREAQGLFIVEGKKSINEFLKSGYELHSFFCVEKTMQVPDDKLYIVSYEELRSISLLESPDDGLAIFRIKEHQAIANKGTIIVLDKIRDPGNLGTIIRLADWFGVKAVVCSTDTTDCYNPKVVQSSMGSLSRMPVYYTALDVFLKDSPLPAYAAALQGDSYRTHPLPKDCLLVMGNEANGISKEIMALCSHFTTIPKAKGSEAESLNVAIATAILLSSITQ